MKKAVFILAVLMLALGTTSSAQLVGSTNRQGGYYEPGFGQNDAGRQRGPLFHFEVGVPCAVTLGYQVSPVLMIGGGIGASFIITEYAPVYAQIRLNTPHNHRAFFLDFKGGYDLANAQGYILLGQVGLLFKYVGVGVGMGYSSAYGGGESLKFCLTATFDLPMNKILY